MDFSAVKSFFEKELYNSKSYFLGKKLKQSAKFIVAILLYVFLNVVFALLSDGLVCCPAVIFQLIAQSLRTFLYQFFTIIFTLISNSGICAIVTLAYFVGFGFVVLYKSTHKESHTAKTASYEHDLSAEIAANSHVFDYKLHVQFLS